MSKGIMLLILLFLLLYFMNKKATFIGKHIKVKIIFTVLLCDLVTILCSTTLIKLLLNTKKDYSIGDKLTVYGVIMIAMVIIAVISLKKILNTLGEIKTIQSTLINCTIVNHGIYYTLSGNSLQGTKNSFNFYGKDKFDVYSAMYNGIYCFDIKYFKSSKRIESIQLLPNGPCVMQNSAKGNELDDTNKNQMINSVMNAVSNIFRK